jgi:hypothetical protein
VEATRPALSASNRRGRPYCYPPSEGLGEVVCPNNSRQQRTPSDAPKGQQLTAQGIALGFCVGVVFFALKVQKLLPQTYYLSRIRELENFSFLEWELLRIGEEIASNFLFPCSHSRRLRRILINSFAGRKIL